jgi:hypothetical protein
MGGGDASSSVRAAALGLALALAAAAPAAAHPRPGTPGAAGIGDKLFPTLGNGGYDALHYDVDLHYATADPAAPVHGTVTLVARATQSLSRFDLDFAGDSVGTVDVNGRAAEWTACSSPSARAGTARRGRSCSASRWPRS